MMEEKARERERQQVTHKLICFGDEAQDLYKRMEEFFSEHNLLTNSNLTMVLDKSYNLVSAFKIALDTLKRAGEAMIRATVTNWYECRYEEDEAPGEVSFEAVSYEGENVWSVLITTPKQGHEKIILHSDAASYCEVFEAVKWEGK